jgi:hypothetical protein
VRLTLELAVELMCRPTALASFCGTSPLLLALILALIPSKQS